MNNILAWVIICTVVICEAMGIGHYLAKGPRLAPRPFWYHFGGGLIEISAVWLAIRILTG